MSSSWMLSGSFTAHSETVLYALARGLLVRRLKVRFRLDGGLLSCQQPQESNQRRAAPESAPSNQKAIGRSPALLGRGGVFRQAIPGLSKNASASLPRPRLRAAVPPRPVMLGAARRGRTSKAASKAKPRQNQKRRLRFIPFPLPLREGARGRGAFDVAVDLLLMFSPSGCAEHRSPRRTGPRVDAGRGRMPTISPTGHGWPVGETRRGREAQGTHQSPQVIGGRRHRGMFLWLLSVRHRK